MIYRLRQNCSTTEKVLFIISLSYTILVRVDRVISVSTRLAKLGEKLYNFTTNRSKKVTQKSDKTKGSTKEVEELGAKAPILYELCEDQNKLKLVLTHSQQQFKKRARKKSSSLARRER